MKAGSIFLNAAIEVFSPIRKEYLDLARQTAAGRNFRRWTESCYTRFRKERKA